MYTLSKSGYNHLLITAQLQLFQNLLLRLLNLSSFSSFALQFTSFSRFALFHFRVLLLNYSKYVMFWSCVHPLCYKALPAWQPILTAGTVLPAFFVIGVAFVPIGNEDFALFDNLDGDILDKVGNSPLLPSILRPDVLSLTRLGSHQEKFRTLFI